MLHPSALLHPSAQAAGALAHPPPPLVVPPPSAAQAVQPAVLAPLGLLVPRALELRARRALGLPPRLLLPLVLCALKLTTRSSLRLLRARQSLPTTNWTHSKSLICLLAATSKSGTSTSNPSHSPRSSERPSSLPTARTGHERTCSRSHLPDAQSGPRQRPRRCAW